MKRIAVLTLAFAFVAATQVAAGVKVHTPLKVAVTGKKKLFKKASKDIVISDFAINFRTSDWGASGGAVGGVGVAAYIGGLNDELTLSIANGAKAYLEKSLQDKGFNVTYFSAEELAKNRMFKKDIKKGKAEVVSSGKSFKLEHKMASKGNNYLSVVPDGVPVVHFGLKAPTNFATRNWSMLAKKHDLAFNPTFYFVKIEKGGNSTTNKVSWEPQLALSAGALGNGAYHRYFNKKFKSVTLNMSKHILVYEGGTDWLGEGTSKEELYGKSVNYTVDSVKFKEAADAMLKMYIDAVVAAMAENVAGA